VSQLVLDCFMLDLESESEIELQSKSEAGSEAGSMILSYMFDSRSCLRS
jgi:hypothetical protein